MIHKEAENNLNTIIEVKEQFKNDYKIFAIFIFVIILILGSLSIVLVDPNFNGDQNIRCARIDEEKLKIIRENLRKYSPTNFTIGIPYQFESNSNPSFHIYHS